MQDDNELILTRPSILWDANSYPTAVSSVESKLQDNSADDRDEFPFPLMSILDHLFSPS